MSAYVNTATAEVPSEIVEEVRREVRLVVVPEERVQDSPILNIEEEIMLLEVEAVVFEDKEDEKADEKVEAEEQVVEEVPKVEIAKDSLRSKNSVFTVPFYSQFTDITPVSWRKVSCGIAGVAMLIDFYSDESVSADALLQKGIAAGSFLNDAGWIHSGLISLSRPYGLEGESVSLANLGMTSAFAELEEVVKEGPVMVSVHYTFEPTNPIPHLVVINGVQDGKVFYNDPAESSGGNSLSIEKFKNAWKKRYISIRPTS